MNRLQSFLATVERVMAQHAQRPAIGRNIEPAVNFLNYVMSLKPICSEASSAAPAIPPQHIGPQFSPAPR